MWDALHPLSTGWFGQGQKPATDYNNDLSQYTKELNLRGKKKIPHLQSISISFGNMRHSLFQQQAKAYSRVHKTLIFSVVWVSQVCCGLKGNSKPLLRYCTASEPSKPSAHFSSSTDKNTALGWLKPSGDASIANCSNCCSGKGLRWHLTHAETFTRLWEWNKLTSLLRKESAGFHTHEFWVESRHQWTKHKGKWTVSAAFGRSQTCSTAL